MKFNCGITEQKREDAVVKKKRNLKKWHKWFALLPVKVTEEKCAWLEYVERKGRTYQGHVFIDDASHLARREKWAWEYRVKK